MYIGGLHAHWLATHVKTWIQRTSGAETCLIDKSACTFPAQSRFSVRAQLGLECHWDNTQANQPVVGGMQQTARDLNWGELSTQETYMSFYYMAQ